MKNFVRGVAFTLIVLIVGGWLYYRLGYADLRADVQPSWIESEIAVAALRASAARHAGEARNPIPASDANLFDGARLYRDKCADCHGRPDNPSSDYGSSFYPPAPQFMRVHPGLSDAQSFYIIKYGVRRTAMPAWGKIMADSEIWQVVALLDRLSNLPPAVADELHRPALSTP
ncbi:MAG TPA: c-type cytochrome [Verrucomicrobiae bacterium]|nr:c-type cytochrome [Verrucomicrobiae bacterium]